MVVDVDRDCLFSDQGGKGADSRTGSRVDHDEHGDLVKLHLLRRCHGPPVAVFFQELPHRATCGARQAEHGVGIKLLGRHHACQRVKIVAHVAGDDFHCASSSERAMRLL